MNDPKDQPIDVEEQRAWLIEHKAETGSSWGQLARRLGLKMGTLSQFGSANGYGGKEQPLAEAVFRFRQTLTAQAALKVEAPELPGFYETETSSKIVNLLHWGQRGRLVVAAMGPGTGKTITAEHFKACNANVFLATISPSCAGVFNMQHRVLKALGDLDAVGSTQALSHRVELKVRNLVNPLLILDEAQHLTERAIEEIRSWHDNTGLGIALLGNESVLHRLEGGSRSIGMAQIFSRISLKLVRSYPLRTDIEAMLDAWGITDPDIEALIHKIGKLPGGMRGATFTLELAKMIARSEHGEITVGHVHDAWAQLSSKPVSV